MSLGRPMVQFASANEEIDSHALVLEEKVKAIQPMLDAVEKSWRLPMSTPIS